MTLSSDLRTIARALGGIVSSGQVLAPDPGHGAADRSMTVRLSPSAPEGFLAFSHAGDPWPACRDHIRHRLGLEAKAARKLADEYDGAQERGEVAKRGRQTNIQAENVYAPATAAEAGVSPKEIFEARKIRDAEPDPRTALALDLWEEGVDPRRTRAQTYLEARGLRLDDDLAGPVLRWHANAGAMLAHFRNIHTGASQAVTRTFLDDGGRKLGRKFLGPVAGGAIMPDLFQDVLTGLHIGEGIETCLAARMLDLRPAWALGSKSAIAVSCPIRHRGINDPRRTGRRA